MPCDSPVSDDSVQEGSGADVDAAGEAGSCITLGTEPLVESAVELVGARVGNYVIERPLAKGGMGSVFVAKHPTLGREAAVKFLSHEVSRRPEFARRFLDEARITASLRHPNIVDIFDFGELGGRYYYVMELLEGRDLAAQMRLQRRFEPEQVALYLEQICSALGAAHAVGVVHRDLKPGNVFVLDGEPLRIKLMDFGVAKVMSRTGAETRFGDIIGTPTHMAPEQAMGYVDRICAQTDLYSLGVIAYEMLTGGPLFQHKSDVMLLMMHIQEPVRPIRSIVSAVPDDFASIVEECLRKEPSERPASAAKLAADLAEAIRRAQSKPVAIPEARAASAPVAPAPALPSDARAIEPRPSPPLEVPAHRSEPVPSEPGAPARPALKAVPAPAPEHISLTKHDRTALERVLKQLERHGDFPAFVRNVGEVSMKADAAGAYSARQLSASILKDQALTAKLLRIVNHVYAHRFGGKVFSVNHAIVILGFDRVRSIALSISLFKNSKDRQNSDLAADSAIGCVVSGEIARSLADCAGVEDPEQAALCGMFRNLGYHLVVVYLPELHRQMLELMERQSWTLDAAAQRVLGLSLRKLGVGVAQRWRLPERLLQAIATVTAPGARPGRDEERLSALAEFSTELCEIVSSAMPGTRDAELRDLLSRHRNLLALTQEELPELLQDVQETFVRRYSALGLDMRQSRFSRNLAMIGSQQRDSSPPSEPSSADVPSPDPLRVPRARQDPPAPAPALRAGAVRDAKAKPTAVPLQLAKQVITNDTRTNPDGATSPEDDQLAQRIVDIAAALEQGHSSERVLSMALHAAAEYLSLPRVLALTADARGGQLVVRGGVGEDVEALANAFTVPLKPPRSASDAFSSAYHSGKDVVIQDVFAEAARLRIPLSYYEAIGSPVLMVLSCVLKGHRGVVLLMADLETSPELPAPERLAAMARLRELIVRAI
ncbi:MAG: HDOD domain-containing protein [Polyangiaceae bacterium]|nr:HDOD domain-containing protein [Polyangiaceae bacterium]